MAPRWHRRQRVARGLVRRAAIGRARSFHAPALTARRAGSVRRNKFSGFPVRRRRRPCKQQARPDLNAQRLCRAPTTRPRRLANPRRARDRWRAPSAWRATCRLRRAATPCPVAARTAAGTRSRTVPSELSAAPCQPAVRPANGPCSQRGPSRGSPTERGSRTALVPHAGSSARDGTP